MQNIDSHGNEIDSYSDGKTIQQLEVDTLLEVIKLRYRYDFTHYSKASIIRRIERMCVFENVEHISELIPRILYDESFFARFIKDLTVTVTEMFRDPKVYIALREKVLPFLETFPRIKIWHAGCATGEEAYSMAILLHEAGLYDRSKIYATDINEDSLMVARNGIYPNDSIKIFTRNYQQAGGQSVFSNYYHAKYESAIFEESLKKNILFANHNLVHDQSFGEMQLIVCRNVLIYFNNDLKNRVLSLFKDSLCNRGILCLGIKENLQFSTIADQFERISKPERIFQKRVN